MLLNLIKFKLNLLIYIFLFVFLFFIFFINYYFKFSDFNVFEITNKTVCANDGMFLFDFDGPKAQIIWTDNDVVSFFCEPREAFYELFNTVNKKRIKFFFVQNFSNVPWGAYVGRWILAKNAFFVIDSDKNGAMGVSYVPFESYQDAVAFQLVYGGEVLNYNEISLKHVIKSNDLLKQRMLLNF